MNNKHIYLLILISIALLSCRKNTKSIDVFITASQRNIQVGDTVVFNCYLSSDGLGVTRFDWFFEGGDHIENLYSSPPDSVVYNKVGVFDVNLEILGMDEKYYSTSENNFITVTSIE